MEIKGEKVVLIPIKFKERNDFYNLATKSYGSRFWYDKKTKKKKTKQVFFKSWNKDYFNPRKPKAGKCFWIIADDKIIGQINYGKIDTINKKVELDIIIGEKKDIGKGYGTDALKTLIGYLFKKFDINKIWIEARTNNPRAIKAYKKAGFKRETILKEKDYFGGKFVDCIRLMILRNDFLK